MSELVSIITPSYNNALFIEETIESVLNQTYHNWEMIIIDDCSSDNSIEIIKRYAQKEPRIKLIINKENIGVSDSRNRAIKEAKGTYIAFLDSDDSWLPKKLTKQINLMRRTGTLMSYSSYKTINENSKVTGYFIVKTKVSYRDLLKTSTIGTLTTIYNAKKLGKFYFDDRGHEDYVMKLTILKKIGVARGVREPLAHYRIVENSISRNKLQAASWQWKIYRESENLHPIKSLYYFLHYTYNGFTKYKKRG